MILGKLFATFGVAAALAFYFGGNTFVGKAIGWLMVYFTVAVIAVAIMGMTRPRGQDADDSEFEHGN